MAGLPPARREDFRLGRLAAARSLRQLGRRGPVLADGRLPLFPDGLTGSISHRAGVAVCLAAPRTLTRALGVDVELVDSLPPGAARVLCTERERAWLERGPDAGAQLTALFSLKEAVYKALCALGVTISGPKEIDLSGTRAGVLSGEDVPAAWATVRGIRLETGGLRSARSVLTWAVART